MIVTKLRGLGRLSGHVGAEAAGNVLILGLDAACADILCVFRCEYVCAYICIHTPMFIYSFS